MPHPKVKISDDSGNAVSVTSNRLDVNAYLSATPTIDIGDVSLLLGGTAASTNAGTMDAQTLRVTLATDDTHWGAVGAAADDDGVAHGQLRHIATSLTAASSYLAFALSTTGGQYSEGDGGFLSIVRNDTLASLVADDNDYAPLQVNADGALYIDGSNSTQPVSGTVTANLSATDNAVLDAMVVDLAAMEALLITIDSDTDAIKTAVQILDDWDDSNYANVNINLAGSDAPTGGGAESGALRVTLANDSTGVISIDDGGNTITVDGTVTANLSSTDNTVLDNILTKNTEIDAVLDTIKVDTEAIETAVELLDNAIDGSEMQVDIVSGNVTNAGTFATQVDGDALTSLQLLDDVVGTDGSTGPTKCVSIGGTYLTSIQEIAVDAVGNVQVDVVASLPAGSSNIGNVDIASALPAGTNAIGKVGHDITGLQSDNNEGVDDTTAEALGGSQACKRVDMQADPGNTGYIYVGGTDVSAVKGIRLAPGDFYSIDIDNVADIFVLASVDEEDIHFTYYT